MQKFANSENMHQFEMLRCEKISTCLQGVVSRDNVVIDSRSYEVNLEVADSQFSRLT